MTKKTIKASDVLGDNYYIYELTSSNYTPALNGSITITCTMKDVYGTAANGKSITLYQNGTSKGVQTTNSSGVATWSITCSTAGLQKFNIKDTSIEVFVDNKAVSSHQHGNITSDGKLNTSHNGTYSTFIGVQDSTGTLYKASKINSDIIIDGTAHANIGSNANDNQSAINTAINTALGNKANSTHSHIIDLNSFNFYDANNWRTIDGDAPTITSDSVQANAVSHHILNKEFVESKYYTLTFEFNIGSNRGGFYLFGDKDCNMLFEITTDIRNTGTLQHDSNGNTTELYTGTKNHFTSGWHDIKVIRKGATATLYIDDELYYTFNNIGNCTNLLGLLKWSSGSTTIKNVNVSLDVTELPIDDYVDRSELEDCVEKNNLKTIEGMNLIGNEDIVIDVSCGSTVLFEDDCSTDRSSEYTKIDNNCTFTYDNNGYYVLTKSSSSGTSGVKVNSASLPKNVKITVDIQMKSSGNLQPKLVFMDTTQTYGYVSRLTYTNGKGSIIEGSFTTEGSSITGDVTVTQSLNTWYTFEFIKNGNSLTFNIYNTSTGTLVETLTGTGSQTFSENANTVGMAVSYDSGKYYWFKNLKVESLDGDSENTIYLGDDIMTMIDTALGHMITNWEDYD